MIILQEIPSIIDKFQLISSSLPEFTTLCVRYHAIKMKGCRVLLRVSISLHEPGEVQAINATEFGRLAVSRWCCKRISYHFEVAKTTVLVDCEPDVNIYVHCSVKQPHDSKISWRVLTRNLDRSSTIAADKGFDCDDLRAELRDHNIQSTIYYKTILNNDKFHNERLDDVHHLRSNVESAFCALNNQFDDKFPARTWFGQFRELVIVAAIINEKPAVGA